MLGIILALFTALIKSLGELAGKMFTTKNASQTQIDEMSLALGGRIFSMIVLTPVFFIFPLQPISGNMLLVLFASSILNATGLVTTLKAVKYGDLSVVGPLSSLTIPLLVITGFFILGELPNIYGLVGIICIFLGTYLLQIAKSQGGLLGPITALWQDKGAKYMIITSVIWSFTASLDKVGIVEYGVFLWLLYTNIVMLLLALVYAYFFHSYSFREISSFKNIKKISLVTGLAGGGLIIQLFALKFTLAVYVISIKRASGIFSVIFGALFFQEKNIISKLLAASIMLLGVGIISIYGNI